MKKMIEPKLYINEGFSTIERVTIEGLQCTPRKKIDVEKELAENRIF